MNGPGYTMNRISFPVRSCEDVITARRAAAKLAAEIGFASLGRTIIGVVASELARAALVDPEGGELTLIALEQGGVEIEANYSGTGGLTEPDAFRPGEGWWAVRQGVDDLTIDVGPNGTGTKVTARKRCAKVVKPPPPQMFAA